MKSIKNLKSLIIFLIVGGLVLFALIYMLIATIIGYSMSGRCTMAQAKYEGNCTEALEQYLDDDKNTYETRNQAIWALGQIGDERSREVLKKYYTDYDEGKKYDIKSELSQYEIYKALGYLDGKWNITSFFWKIGRSDE